MIFLWERRRNLFRFNPHLVQCWGGRRKDAFFGDFWTKLFPEARCREKALAGCWLRAGGWRDLK